MLSLKMPNVIHTRVFAFVIGLMTLIAPSLGSSKTYEVGELNSSIEIGDQVPYRGAAKGELSARELVNHAKSSAKEWSTWSGKAINFSYTQDEYWLSFKFKNSSSQRVERYLTYDYPLIDELEVTVFDAKGQEVKRWLLGDRLPFAQRPIQNRNFVIPIHLEAGEELHIITRLWSTEALIAPIRLWEPRAFYQTDAQEVTLRGIYYGIVLIMAFYNLFVFFSLRQSVYLAYFVFVMCLSLYQGNEYGFTYQYLWPNQAWWSEKSANLFVSSTILSALVFTSSFLDIKTRGELVYRACRWLQRGALFIALTSLIAPTHLYAILIVIYAGVSLPVMLSAGFKRLFEGSVEARYFCISWSFVIIGNFAYVFMLLNVLPTNLFTSNAPQIGSGLEVILLSLGLGRKFKSLHDENLRIQTEAARELQGKVEERTRALEAKTVEAQEATREAVVQRQEAERLQRQAEATAADLEELDRQKTHFFQNISHELRTPLTLILNPLELSQRARPDDQDLSVALKNTRRLLRLVNQILDFQRLQAGRRVMKLEPVNLNDFVEACAEYFAPACQSKSITFTLETPPQPLWGQGEIDALEKVTFNFLSNALKFTPSGGEIKLCLTSDFNPSTEEERVMISVVDNGVGMTPEEQEVIFEVFTQTQTGEMREYEGSGLGLALAKSLIEEMEGEIGVMSDSGDGSAFWFKLETCQPVEQDAPLNLRGWLFDGQAGQTGLDTDQVEALKSLSGDKPMILVVDDLPDMRTLIKRFLLDLDYEVITASSGEQAMHILEAQEQRRPDLIITDWMMPKMSGPKLIEAVRERADLSSTPIILLTAKSDPESKILGLDSGADAFLGKPFNADELGSITRNLLALKWREREVESLNLRLTEGVLRRYLPEPIIRQVIEGSLTLDEAPQMTSATILFSDLVGFTALSQKLRAPKLSYVLREYLGEMCDIIFKHEGTIDKFIGDAIMVIFGSPTKCSPEEQAQRATQCALEMQERLRALSQRWLDQGQLADPVQMRIGLHFGPMVVGMFGTERRSDYTAIGPTVNLASRIEGLCAPGEVYLSGEICDLLPVAATRFVDYFPIKGLEMEVPVYQLLDPHQPHPLSANQAWPAQPSVAALS